MTPTTTPTPTPSLVKTSLKRLKDLQKKKSVGSMHVVEHAMHVFCFVIVRWSLRSHVRKGTSQGRSVVCNPSGRSDVCCFARSVLSEHREHHSIPAENISERDILSPADKENLLSEENESANSSHQGADKVLADILSGMTQMSATIVFMENAMKRLAGAPEDHATAPKRRRKPPATSAMSDSQDPDPEKSDSEELNFSPNGPPKLGSSVAEDTLLNGIAQDFESDEQTDPQVARKLADIPNKRWGSKLEEAKLKEKLAKYNRPDNCKKLTVPKVNPEIWNKLKHVTTSADLRLANMQKILVKVGSAVAKSTDTLLAMRADPEKTSASASTEKLGKLVTHNADALALLGHVNIELSYRRRDAIKPNLNNEYSSLCGSQVPITGLLFGDELQSQLISISRQLTKLAIRLLQSHLTETIAMAGRANLLTLVESFFREEGPVLPATPQQFLQITGNRKESHPVKCSDIPTDKREYYNQWQSLTLETEILQMILGQPIEFARTPYQRVVPREKKILDLNEQHVIHTEIDKLLAKGAITPSSHEEGEYISPIFTRAKKDGSFRVILNLKCLNSHVQYHHFKTDSLNTVLQMVKPGCFMASIDLKDANYSVPIATAD